MIGYEITTSAGNSIVIGYENTPCNGSQSEYQRRCTLLMSLIYYEVLLALVQIRGLHQSLHDLPDEVCFDDDVETER